MKRTFIESLDFEQQLEALGESDLLKDIQNEILKNPDSGALVKGTGGIRKIRVAAKGKGKSGGIRIFYLDIPTKEKCYLLFLLEKSEKENISAEEKSELRAAAQRLKK